MIICIIDFLLDPLKPHFYYISTGLRGSFSHEESSLMLIPSYTPRVFRHGPLLHLRCRGILKLVHGTCSRWSILLQWSIDTYRDVSDLYYQFCILDIPDVHGLRHLLSGSSISLWRESFLSGNSLHVLLLLFVRHLAHLNDVTRMSDCICLLDLSDLSQCIIPDASSL